MIQDFDSQLQVSLRALEEVVAPALAGAEKHVVEQLHLAMLTIGFVKQRLPEARRFARWELSAYIDLARELGEDAALASFIADGTAELQRPGADIADFELITRRGRDAIAAFVDASGDRRVADKVLEGSKPIVDQARLWCAPFGFELRPEALPAAAW